MVARNREVNSDGVDPVFDELDELDFDAEKLDEVKKYVANLAKWLSPETQAPRPHEREANDR